MKTMIVLMCAILLAEPFQWIFEDAAAGKLPDGWSAHKTGDGRGSDWKVVEDIHATSGRHVLAQTSSAGARPLFNVAVCDESNFKDLDLTVAVKAVKGEIDRGGGPVWRFRDANNYYICRWNPLEDNFRVYKVVDGKRMQLATVDLKIAADQWQTIRVVHSGSHIRCYLDGKLHLDVMDDTFTQAGKVGLWSKADAVTFFDDLTVREPQSK